MSPLQVAHNFSELEPVLLEAHSTIVPLPAGQGPEGKGDRPITRAEEAIKQQRSVEAQLSRNPALSSMWNKSRKRSARALEQLPLDVPSLAGTDPIVFVAAEVNTRKKTLRCVLSCPVLDRAVCPERL